MKSKLIGLAVCFLGIVISGFGQFKKITIDGADLNYLDKGTGEVIVFVHGGMEDYRTWNPQMEIFSRSFRVINYSRRFNFPNQNTIDLPDFSAQTEAKDLALLITQLNLLPVHLVGHSFGGLVALCLALRYPTLVRSLTLSEPPVISWLPGLNNGQPLYDDFYKILINPLQRDFAQNDTAAVLRHTLIYFYGADVSKDLAPDVRAQLLANLREWRNLNCSSNAFPPIAKQEVREIKVPVFLLCAGNTMPLLKVTNSELKSLLPHAKTFTLVDGTHDYWVTHPKQMGDALMNFLQAIRQK